jgi:hypothetical protein
MAPGVYSYFSGFDSAEVAIVIVKEFPKNGSFTNVVDTFVYSSALPTSYLSQYGDTVPFTNYPFDHTFFIRYEYDCEIDIPATGEVYKVTGISFGKESTANTEEGCTSSMSCYVNGKLQRTPFSNSDYDGDAGVTIQK